MNATLYIPHLRVISPISMKKKNGDIYIKV